MKKITPRYVIIKLLKTSEKEKTLKAARVKRHITYKGTKIGMMAISFWERTQPEDRE